MMEIRTPKRTKQQLELELELDLATLRWVQAELAKALNDYKTACTQYIREYKRPPPQGLPENGESKIYEAGKRHRDLEDQRDSLQEQIRHMRTVIAGFVPTRYDLLVHGSVLDE